jgi:hypothetical protein
LAHEQIVAYRMPNMLPLGKRRGDCPEAKNGGANNNGVDAAPITMASMRRQ